MSTTATTREVAKPGPGRSHFRLTVFAIAMVIFLSSGLWYSWTLRRKIVDLEGQLRAEQAAAAPLAGIRSQAEDYLKLRATYEEVLKSIVDLRHSPDPAVAMGALDTALGSTADVSVGSMRMDGLHVSLEIAAPSADAAAQFRQAVEHTGSFTCKAPQADAARTGIFVVACDFKPPQEEETP
jgi:hypothetical protein